MVIKSPSKAAAVIQGLDCSSSIPPLILFIDSLSEDIKNNEDFIYSIWDFYATEITSMHLWFRWNENKYLEEFNHLHKLLSIIISNFIIKNNDADLLIEIIKHQAEEFYWRSYAQEYDFYLYLPSNIINNPIAGRTKPKLSIKEYYLILNACAIQRAKTKQYQNAGDFFDVMGLDGHSVKGFKDKKSKSFYKKLVKIKGIETFKVGAIPKKYFNDKDFIIFSINKSYKILKYASWRLKCDPDVLNAAYLKNPNSFKKLLTRSWILKLNLKNFPLLLQERIYNAYMNRIKETDVLLLAKYKKGFITKTSSSIIIDNC